MATKKLKTNGINIPVPQTRDEANDAIARIGEAQRKRSLIEVAMNEEMAKVKEKFEKEAEPLNAEIAVLSKGVQCWCEANRSAITNGGKVKYAEFAAGGVKWRLRPEKVVIKGAESVMEQLKSAGLVQFIRTKEEINKERMLAEKEALADIKGVQFDQGEDFVVTPFETSLEAIAGA